jgi:hypothetical protein
MTTPVGGTHLRRGLRRPRSTTTCALLSVLSTSRPSVFPKRHDRGGHLDGRVHSGRPNPVLLDRCARSARPRQRLLRMEEVGRGEVYGPLRVANSRCRVPADCAEHRFESPLEHRARSTTDGCSRRPSDDGTESGRQSDPHERGALPQDELGYTPALRKGTLDAYEFPIEIIDALLGLDDELTRIKAPQSLSLVPHRLRGPSRANGRERQRTRKRCHADERDREVKGGIWERS